MAEIKQRISLDDSAEDVRAKLKKIGDAGKEAFSKPDRHARRGDELQFWAAIFVRVRDDLARSQEAGAGSYGERLWPPLRLHRSVEEVIHDCCC